MGDVLVVIGVGGMGGTIARRLAPGRTTVLADYNESLLSATADSMRADGFDVVAQHVDVSSRESVHRLVEFVAKTGKLSTLVHTAGVSPTMMPLDRILAIDLAGVAYTLEEFGAIVNPDTAGVVVSSMSSYLSRPFTPEQEHAIRVSTGEQLLKLDFFSEAALGNSGVGYGVAKLANRIQVQAASIAWGARGARINAVSPGVISTGMGQQELDSPSGAFMQAMVDNSGTGRIGTASDIADAVTFLVGPQASFITGIDLLVDGGAIAAVYSGKVPLPTA
ncbi:SDR family oxidoreductase [Bifidobacterium aquikefiri]|uniref:Short-chain dehydrogenase n=1 Tax=Bifidobacterium aquikefiri TaxID=1653207 RepID=A0A261GBF1_9BIFI|nr:SDR family oxidoreductase [Bifidobacterium aquikefiri]OZG68761.1 short-chain dehydrogenase [Bifidobacterium aquikefiri]